MTIGELKLCIEEAIYEYKKVDPMTEEILGRTEELEWVLGMLENLNYNKEIKDLKMQIKMLTSTDYSKLHPVDIIID